MIILTGKADSYAQFITVLFIFVAVLAVTALVTKWIAGYQKQQGAAGNIEVRETVRIANNKYIQLVRIGESYFAIAVCKDTVTALGQIPAEQLKGKTTLESTSGFRELLERAAKKENEEKDHRCKYKIKDDYLYGMPAGHGRHIVYLYTGKGAGIGASSDGRYGSFHGDQSGGNSHDPGRGRTAEYGEYCQHYLQ